MVIKVWCKMIGPESQVPHPRSVLKRKLAPSVPSPPEVPVKRSLPEVVDIVSDVCSYETISDYIEMFGNDTLEQEQGGSPASLESGYQTATSVPDDEDSNLSWLLNFKVSSLFDPTEEIPPVRREETCLCNGTGHQRTTGSGKPPFTYTELIEKALNEQGQLTVSGIYNWISTNYPFYSPNDDRWKNSVRHNLSINPHFRKGLKSRHGAGHLWTLSNEGVNPPPDSWKRVRTVMSSVPKEPVDEAAIAAATIMQLDDDEPATSALTVPECDPALPLHRVAEEILSGVKRQVEVQYLVHDHNTSVMNNMPDHTILLSIPSHFTPEAGKKEFINPISKEEIVSESGLDTSHCEAASSLLSDLNTELHLPDNLFSDELAFPCYSQL